MSKIKNFIADYAENMADAVALHAEGSEELADAVRMSIYAGEGCDVAPTRRARRAVDYAIKRNKRLHARYTELAAA